jgi:uncharacterized phage protein (TIGR02218 family)
MLNLTPSLRAKLDARATTFCHCWRLARRDGAVIGFTDHDRDLAFNGVVFLARTGLSASQLETQLGLAANAAEAAGALTSEGLCEKDLLNGLYDGASVETWLVDWSDIDDRLLLDVATIGEVRRGEFAFTAELRSAAHVFDQPQGRAFQRGCSADLGDARCGVDLDAPAFNATGSVLSFLGGIMTLDVDADFAEGFFAGGAATFTSGVNAGARLTIKSHRQAGRRASLAFWTPPAAEANPGDGVRLTAGCDKTAATCNRKFANIVNFRGFPHMPGNDRVVGYPNSSSGAMDGGSLFR